MDADLRQTNRDSRRDGPPRTIIFFDIDGTLIDTAGAGRAAMLRALRESFGVEPRIVEVDFAGRTDRAIARDLLLAHGLNADEQTLDRFLSDYVQFLPEELARRPQGRVLPAVHDVLNRLVARHDVAMGLLTGNVREGAYRKLSHFGIDHFFQFGGFGDRWLDRADVARDALDAARMRFGSSVSPGACWVIGDTVHDIACARAIGARAIAVLTGGSAPEALREAGPDAVLQTLAEIDTLLRI